MAIAGIEQPELLPVGEGLRLRKFDGCCAAALAWYQDPETVYLVDGVTRPYTPEKLERMYRCLEGRGELYWIELCENGVWRPVGDVTFSQTDLPIVIGERSIRGRGIGRRVVAALMERARTLGWRELWVEEIYAYNTGSRRCFEHAGFCACAATEKGARYHCVLGEAPRETT